MANSNIKLVNLDFDTLKDNFKTYLKSQDRFKDYDFDGSNMAVLLDIMAYNTYLNSFYTNMVGAEMFLDTAQLRDSVLSHAKELNYLPRSFKSAEAVVNLTVNAGNTAVTSLTVPKGTSFSTRIGSNTFSFSTDRNRVLVGSNGVFTANSISLFEGDYIDESFTVNYATSNQRFVLSNPTIDTSSLTVTVIEDNGANVIPYTYATSLFGLSATSTVFFLQAAENEKYEIIFGDGVVGKKPKNGAIVVADYRVTNGELPNGAFKFVVDGPIQSYSNVIVSTITAAVGGAVSESLESIRFNAPRHFTTQERAVTATDYETLLKGNFPEISAISVYGGEEVSPPQYGRVFISVDITDVEGLPTTKINDYFRFVKERSPVSIEPIFVDPDFTSIEVVSQVNFDANLTDLGSEDIETLVISAINTYNTTNLNSFKKTLRYSRLVDTIDGAHPSIVSNETTVRAIKSISPTLNKAQNIFVDFGLPLQNDLGTTQLSGSTRFAVQTSQFFFQGRRVIVADDGLGVLNMYAAAQDSLSFIKEVGTVDYNLGTLQFNALIVSSFVSGNQIKIYVRTRSNDIYSRKNTILNILSQDLRINAVRVTNTPEQLEAAPVVRIPNPALRTT
jgi:hypothetical protein